MSENAPAGWYPQPDGRQRYWDGQQWTDHFHPPTAEPAAATSEVAEPVVAAPAPAEPAIVEPAPVPVDVAPTEALPTATPAPPLPVPPLGIDSASAAVRPWWKKKRFIIPGAAIVSVFLIGALAQGGEDDDPATSPTAAAIAETPSATPSPSDAAEEVPTTFVMPDLVGANLQDAQDQLQALGSYLMDQEDASGLDRMQLDDSNWQVCTQDPAAGTEVPIEATVLLASVKLDESCDGEVVAEPAQEEAEEAPALTTSQEQAVRSAEQYLTVMAFSRVGLIEQLEYEGFSKADAKFAVDSLHQDWNEQAALMAQNYLDTMSFSRSGLIEQLEYEGFSHKQAVYGVDSTGL